MNGPFRDYLTGIQIHGYALVSTCLNYKKQHEIFHVLSKVGLDRLLQQETALGGYYNDWYHYGKASCSYQIQMLKQQDKCIRVPDEQSLELFNDYQNVKIG